VDVQRRHRLSTTASPPHGPEDTSSVLRYADGRRGQRRAMRLTAEGTDRRLDAFLLAGDTRAEEWIRPLLLDRLPAQAYGRHLLVAGGKPPLATGPRARQICTCLNVSDVAINACLVRSGGHPDQRLSALQASVKCGTQCGSCVPELKRMIAATPALREAA
jgi:assimilatory nitrate reductase catalytic subunit